MKSFRMRLATFTAVAALMTGGMAQAQQTTNSVSYSPFALNLWAGIAYDYLNTSVNLANVGSSSHVGAAFGGDLGFRFAPTFGLVALAEYAPVFGTPSASVTTVGGGIRLQPAPTAQFVLGAGYSSLAIGGGNTSGWGVKLLGFWPIAMGFGPYLQLAYNDFATAGGGTNFFTANGGLSFSY